MDRRDDRRIGAQRSPEDRIATAMKLSGYRRMAHRYAITAAKPRRSRAARYCAAS